jgi:hypothetical protein
MVSVSGYVRGSVLFLEVIAGPVDSALGSGGRIGERIARGWAFRELIVSGGCSSSAARTGANQLKRSARERVSKPGLGHRLKATACGHEGADALEALVHLGERTSRTL